MPRSNIKQKEAVIGSVPGPKIASNKPDLAEKVDPPSTEPIVGPGVDLNDELWSSVDEADRVQVEALFSEIRVHRQAETRFILEKGAELAIVKVVQGHGNFEKLILRQTGLKPKTSQRWRKAGRIFKNHIDNALKLQREAIYQLCADGVWVAPVREKVLSDIKDGVVPSLTEVKRRLNEAEIEHDPSRKPLSKAEKDARTARVSEEAERIYTALVAHFPKIREAVKGDEWSYVKAKLIEKLDELRK